MLSPVLSAPGGDLATSLLAGGAPTQTPGGPSVGQQFEEVFVSLLIKELRSTVSEGGLFPGDSSDTYGGMFDMYLGRHLAGSGSFGIAQSVDQYVARRDEAGGDSATETEPAPSNPGADL